MSSCNNCSAIASVHTFQANCAWRKCGEWWVCSGKIESFLVVFGSGSMIMLVPCEDTQGQGHGDLHAFKQDLAMLSSLKLWVQLGCRLLEWFQKFVCIQCRLLHKWHGWVPKNLTKFCHITLRSLWGKSFGAMAGMRVVIVFSLIIFLIAFWWYLNAKWCHL